MTVDEIESSLSAYNRQGLIKILGGVEINPIVKAALNMQISMLSDKQILDICGKGLTAISIYKTGTRQELVDYARGAGIPDPIINQIEKALITHGGPVYSPVE